MTRVFKSHSHVMFVTLLIAALFATVPVFAQTEISYLGRGAESERAIYQQLIEDFMAENPDIKVRLDWIAGNAPEIYERVLVLTAAGTPPDAYWIHTYSIGDLAAQNLLYSLNPLIDRDDVGIDDYYPASVEEFIRDGQVLGLPRESSTAVLFYNVDLFNEGGLEAPNETWNWESLLDASKKLTVPSDSNPQYGIVAPTSHAHHLSMVWQNGGRFLNEDRTQSVLGSPESVEATTWVHNLMYEHQVAAAPGTPQPNMNRGDVAMEYNIRARAIQLNNAEINWGAAIVPTGKERWNRIASAGHGVHAQTENADAAYRLVRYLSGPEGIGALASSGIVVPPLRSVAADVFTEERDQVFYQAMEYARPEPVTPSYFDVIGEKNAVFNAIWRNEVPIQSALTELDRVLTSMIDSE